MSDERVPSPFKEDLAVLSLIAERLRTKGSVTLRDLERLLRPRHERVPSTA
jgi:hypothetical protein